MWLTYYDGKVWNYGTAAITKEIAELELFEVMWNEKSSDEKQTTHQKGIWNIVAPYSLESLDIVSFLERITLYTLQCVPHGLGQK